MRVAGAADADLVGELLHAFAAELGDPTPGAAVLGRRARPLIERVYELRL